VSKHFQSTAALHNVSEAIRQQSLAQKQIC
jgi:hypothetical protein